MSSTPATKRVSRRSVLRATALGSLAMAARRRARVRHVRLRRTSSTSWRTISGTPTSRCYGRPDLRTPNIDRIAARGVRFLQGYANSAVCSATRTALITGRYQYRLRVGLDEPLGRQHVSACRRNIRRCRRCSRRRATARRSIGKWHLGHAAEFRSAQERLRSFLRLPRRRPRLLPAHARHGPERRSVGRRRAGAPDGIPDRAASATARSTSSTDTPRRVSRSS